MYSSTLIALLCVCAGVSAQGGDQYVSSIANLISAGFVDGRKSGFPESEASSKVNEIYQLIMSQSNIREIISGAAGINPTSIKAQDITSYYSFIQTKISELSTFQDSDASTTLSNLAMNYGPYIDTDKLYTAISTELEPALWPVVKQVSSLSAQNSDVSSIVGEAGTQLAMFFEYYGINNIIPTGSPSTDSEDSTTDSDSTTATRTSSGASATSASRSSHSSSSAGGSTSHSNGASSSETKLTGASSTGTPAGTGESASQAASSSATVAHGNNQPKNTIAIAGAAGAAIAAGFLLL